MEKLVILVFLAGSAMARSGWGSYGGGWDSYHGGWDSYYGGGRYPSSGWGNNNNHNHHNGGGWGKPTSPRPTPAPGTGGNPNNVTKADNRTLDQIHQAALAEGGKLIVYAGGDAPGQLDDSKRAFESRFPGMTVELIVDFSKIHDARIDYQLATNSVVFDLVQLQTLQDFPRWKDEGVLLNYKPVGWEHIRKEYKDEDGFYTGLFMDTFTTAVNTQLLPDNTTWPVEARDYLKPEFKDKIVATFPNDDDAVLFWFFQAVEKYGVEYLEKFKLQNPHLVRGTQTAYDAVMNAEYPVTMSADAGLRKIPGLPQLVLPKEDGFVLWAQTGAIFKDAKHKEAAKLWMSWQVDKQTQENGWNFSVRDDVPPPAGYGYKDPEDYQTSHQKFLEFMQDREQVEIFRNTVTLILGPVVGPSPNGELGLHPVTAIPH